MHNAYIYIYISTRRNRVLLVYVLVYTKPFMPTVIKTIETHFGTHLHKSQPLKMHYSNREWQSVSFTMLHFYEHYYSLSNNHGNRSGNSTRHMSRIAFLDRFFLSFFFFNPQILTRSSWSTLFENIFSDVDLIHLCYFSLLLFFLFWNQSVGEKWEK